MAVEKLVQKGLRAAAHAVALQGDLAVLQDQEPGRAAAGHVVAEAEADVAHVKGQVRERTGVRRERPHRVAAPDDTVRPGLDLLAVGRHLVIGRRVRDVRSRPLRIGVAAVHATASRRPAALDLTCLAIRQTRMPGR